MNNNLSTFRRFNNEQDLNAFASILDEFKIEYELENNSATVDTTLGTGQIDQDFRVKLNPTDFEIANTLLRTAYQQQIDSVDKDYYLFKFSTEELIEIVIKSEEWGVFDYVLAQKILKDRGQELTSELINAIKKQRIEQLSKPEENSYFWISSGYLFALGGGFIGFWLGFMMYTNKKTLPNGEKVYSFSKNDRNQGKIIMVIGAIMFPIVLFIRLNYWYR